MGVGIARSSGIAIELLQHCGDLIVRAPDGLIVSQVPCEPTSTAGRWQCDVGALEGGEYTFRFSFESPTQAVLGGMAIQDRLWQYNRSAQEAERLDVRVAINVGEVRVESNDVFGEPVNIASRVQHLATSHEIFATRSVLDDPGASRVLAASGLMPTSHPVVLRGITDQLNIFTIP